jgi:hypothetical protein
MPVVYILTNQSMPNMIKIGVTENLERRIKELDNTSTPMPFECYYAVEVKDASIIEKKIHEGFDDKRIRQNREFFSVSAEQAKSILQIAEHMGGKDVTPKEDIVENELDKQVLEKSRKIRKRFNFGMVNLKPGTILNFEKDQTITCEVHDEYNIKFRDQITSVSAAAHIILKEMGFDWQTVHGPRYWLYKNKTLNDLRDEQD